MLHHTAVTHQLGGMLHVVITREDAGCVGHVDVVDVGNSGHQLLCWEVSATRVTSPSVPLCSRAWRRLWSCFVLFCRRRGYVNPMTGLRPDDVDEMATLYDSELTAELDVI